MIDQVCHFIRMNIENLSDSIDHVLLSKMKGAVCLG